jgi:hypothetical protein
LSETNRVEELYGLIEGIDIACGTAIVSRDRVRCARRGALPAAPAISTEASTIRNSRRRSSSMRVRTASSLVLSLLVAACVYNVRQPAVESLHPPTAPGTTVSSPVKAHLLDGSVVHYAGGVTFDRDTLRGPGERYDLRLRPVGAVERLPLDSVAGMETFRSGTNVPLSVALSLAATALATVGSALLAVAIFGSCPTIYADVDGTAVLEAESFSYSIAPLFEQRDVDRLVARPGADGVLTLEVRNEALETHFLNHMELLEVRHAPGDFVLPDAGGLPVVTRGAQPPLGAMDRSGRDVRAILAAPDGDAYDTPYALLEGVTEGDAGDHIDVVFPAPAGADSAALMLRMRNSLLTTILLYDVMLGSQGASALDWLGTELDQVGSALELGQWYNRTMGLRIAVWDGGAFRDAGRLGDSGPIAWKDVAFIVPVLTRDSVRVRLSFVADAWRFDRVALASYERPAFRTIGPMRVSTSEAGDEPDARAALQHPDERYLETTPGQRFWLHFETGGGADATYLLASQGYYTEWVRPSWIRDAAEPVRFRPTDAVAVEAITRWRGQRAAFERQFHETRIPVR